ncbi:hypothetical protein FSP39_016182 [Pinctada imbricata]|uniref:Integrase catalytic domain-containing protein n=1 Tax=Pinctada imbricata TaxID=66713 RepID=A0AA88YHL4_PINIB|nr:hypothetical protein FSP39_016182 [Pinctada imbricata]
MKKDVEVYSKACDKCAARKNPSKSLKAPLKPIEEFACRFGMPMTIHTDQGTDFQSKLLSEIYKMMGIERTRTSPYHPQCDGQVERFNRTLLDMLSKFCNERQNDWDLYLPQLMLSYRTSINSSTKFSPAFIMFGRELRLPVDLMIRPITEEVQNTATYVQKLRERFHRAFEIIRTNLNTAHLHQKDYYERGANFHEFQPGDNVRLFCPGVKKGQSTKLHSPWKGPYIVLAKLSDLNYRIKLVGGMKKKVVHINRMKPYVNPVAQDDQDTQRTQAAQEIDANNHQSSSCHDEDLFSEDESIGQGNTEAFQDLGREQISDEVVDDLQLSTGEHQAEALQDKDSSSSGTDEGAVGRLQRVRRPPKYLEDYETELD